MILQVGKTAYVNGQKITGSITSTSVNPITVGQAPVITDDGANINVDRGYGKKLILNTGQQMRSTISYADMANLINLTTGKIVSGNTILGIAGTGGSTINNQDKTVTQNGTYVADSGYTGLGEVTVNVPIANTSEYNSDLSLSQQILGSNALPYIPLEYIESSGTQYIDTGMHDHNGVFISNRLMFIHPEDTWNFPIGAQETVNDKVDGCNVPITAYRRPGQSITYFTFYTDTNITQTNMIVHNDALYDIYASTLINNSYMNINDTIITDTSRSNIGTKNMYIFALNNGGSPGFFSSLKLYYLQIYNSKNVLMRDFIPVKRKSDNEICLYDRVTNQFFTNQGTGDFIAGPVIN